jgi:hypothetical protein
MGRAAMRSSSVVVAPGAHGAIGGSPRGGLAGVAVPVIHQGELQHCASYGPASALAACGFVDEAALLVREADTILKVTTSQAKAAVAVLEEAGGWSEPTILNCATFDPLADRSPLPTIVQLSDSHDDNTHVVGIAGDYVYNSNWRERRLLSPEALDACCDGTPGSFKHASYAARLRPGTKLRNRARQALADAAETKAKQPRLDL